jgi:heme oxygenase
VSAHWHLRRRGDAILKDLEALGSDLPQPTAPPAFGTPAAVLGGIYVLEGSRLGGALLSRSLPATAPRAFLAAPGDSRRWRKLLEDLERLLYRHDLVSAAVAAAVDVFACFAAAGRRELEKASP